MNLFEAAKRASTQVSLIPDAARAAALEAVADAICAHSAELLSANAEDLARMDPQNPLYDRLKLTQERLEGIASDMRHVAALPSPLGRTLEDRTLPNGLRLRKVSVPFGVIGVVYEARPNVTFDVFSLCFKSGNVSLLKGGNYLQFLHCLVLFVEGFHELGFFALFDGKVVYRRAYGGEFSGKEADVSFKLAFCGRTSVRVYQSCYCVYH